MDTMAMILGIRNICMAIAARSAPAHATIFSESRHEIRCRQSR